MSETTLGAAIALVVALLAAGCAEPVRKISDGSLRNATARGAADAIRGIGYKISGGMRCRTLSPESPSVVRVRCVGRTTGDEPVRVDAVAHDATTAHPRQEFVITVAGHEVMRTPCLGQGCRP